MKKDEKVFDLLPTSNKLLIRVERTYRIVQKVERVDYKVDVDES